VDHSDAGLAALSSLDDPVRARLYEVVAACSAPVGRDEAAAAAGIGRPLAAYHLDKLVDLGLLTATYQRPASRTGPGAGRPAKLYARSGREFAAAVPPREYELAARLLAVAVQSDTSGQTRAALGAAARQYGARLASGDHAVVAARAISLADAVGNSGAASATEAARAAGTGSPARAARTAAAASAAESARTAAAASAAESANPAVAAGPSGAARVAEVARAAVAASRGVETALRSHGFEPWRTTDGTVQMRNCPFHQLAAQYPDMVCGMSLALVDGLIEGFGAGDMRAQLDPRPGRCCVVIIDNRGSADAETTESTTAVPGTAGSGTTEPGTTEPETTEARTGKR
jgi:predicted ArsR family transcriptional regulator